MEGQSLTDCIQKNKKSMGNNVAVESFMKKRRDVRMHIQGGRSFLPARMASVLECMGLGKDLAIVRMYKDRVEGDWDAWESALRNMSPMYTQPGRVTIVMDKLQSIWSPTRCQVKGLDEDLVVDLTLPGGVSRFSHDKVERIIQQCRNQFLYIAVLWVWKYEDQPRNHFTMLLFNIRKKSLEFFDPTDGLFVYQNQLGMGLTGNRWDMMTRHILPPWRAKGWSFLEEQTSLLPPIQNVVEQGWSRTEAEQVEGYCSPIMLLVYSLCMRMNLVSPTVAALGLRDYVSHTFQSTYARETFRTALLLWYQKLYKAGTFNGVCECIGLRKRPFLPSQTVSCQMYRTDCFGVTPRHSARPPRSWCVQ